MIVKLTDEELKEAATDILKTCYDPEIPVNIYELGLIYEVNPQPDGSVHVKMTLTAPNCPVAGSLPSEIEQKLKDAPEIKDAIVEVVWDPPWEMSMMSDAAKLQLGMM